ncbi:GAF domain-containing protein [Spirosoma koreense]
MDTQDDDLQQADLSPRFRLSFKPFIDYLKQQKALNGCSVELDRLREFLIQKLTAFFPDENQDEQAYDPDQLAELFQLITFSVLPLTRMNQDLPYAFGLPQPLRLFHYSAEFGRLMSQKAAMPMELKMQVTADERLRFGYRMILEKCYKVQLPKKPSVLTFQKEAAGLVTYYRINVDNTFMNPIPPAELPPLQPEWIDFARGLISSRHELAQPMPVQEFLMEGFNFFLIEDVTETETTQRLREIFAHLQSEPEPVIYNRFEQTLRNFGGQPDLQIGIVPFLQVNDRYVHYPAFASRSVFLTHSGTLSVEQAALERIIQYIGRHGQPTVTPDLTQARGSHLRALHKRGIRSFLFYPIRMGNQLLGTLEMASPHANALNEETLRKFESVIPLVQEFLLYQRGQFNAALDRIIKQQFTNLQPAVEWKFNEAAWHTLLEQTKPSRNEINRVRFPKVYPIYGAIDIRNSSIERHKAIQQDFSQQLAAITVIFDCPIMPNELLLPDLLLSKVKHWQKRLAAELNPDDEAEITLFLTDEIRPYLQHLQGNHPELADSIQHYFSQLDETTGQFNQALKAYERSIRWLNTTVKDYISEAETKLQAIYPHYAETFRTDGLEYTLYVGQSMAPQRPFEPEHLHQLYAWQLSSMIDIARLTHRLRPHLPLPLQTTQLILAQSHPLDINFRQDEHRFDVEGSYSIRYEVIKKRIDKAYILDTSERLTQPGTVALVYANHQDIAPYLPLIETLRDQQKIQHTVDQVELEPLQGVFGLKALRLHINFD